MRSHRYNSESRNFTTPVLVALQALLPNVALSFVGRPVTACKTPAIHTISRGFLLSPVTAHTVLHTTSEDFLLAGTSSEHLNTADTIRDDDLNAAHEDLPLLQAPGGN